MKMLAGGKIEDNDWLVTGGHKFFCDDLLDIATIKFLPKKKDFTSSELFKLITTKVTDENGHKCKLKFTVCFELSDGCNPCAVKAGTSEWIKELFGINYRISKL